MLFFWRLSPRGDGVKERSPSQQPRAPADVADSYGAKRPEPTEPGGGSRRNDYGARGSSLSRGPRSVHRRPFRLFVPDRSRGPFTTGDRQLLFPGVLRDEAFAWAALLAFVLCAAAYLIKSGYEVAQRSLNVPKTLHMTLAASLFFITPALQNLDVACQGLNTWHSFQYEAHGMIGSATVARFAARGWGLYAVGIGSTAACGVLYLALRGLVLLIDAWPGDVMQQHYFCFYVSVLSALLIHYYSTTSSSSASTASSPAEAGPEPARHHPIARVCRFSATCCRGLLVLASREC